MSRIEEEKKSITKKNKKRFQRRELKTDYREEEKLIGTLAKEN